MARFTHAGMALPSSTARPYTRRLGDVSGELCRSSLGIRVRGDAENGPASPTPSSDPEQRNTAQPYALPPQDHVADPPPKHRPASI